MESLDRFSDVRVSGEIFIEVHARETARDFERENVLINWDEIEGEVDDLDCIIGDLSFILGFLHEDGTFGPEYEEEFFLF